MSFCFIKYTDSSQEAAPQEKELIVNLNCPIKIVVNYIKDVVKIDGDCDLTDLSGHPKDVNDFYPWQNGLEVLEARQNYNIVLIEKDEYGLPVKMEPLIPKPGKRYSEIMAALKKYMNSRRLFYEKKRRGSEMGSLRSGSPGSSMGSIRHGRKKSQGKISKK